MTNEQSFSENDSRSESETAPEGRLSCGHSSPGLDSSPVVCVENKKGEIPEGTVETPGVESDREQDSQQPMDSKVAEDDWLHLMDTFTGKPCENDVLLYALPVCGPYSALSNYKFKVKLTPGNSKRGQGMNSFYANFLSPLCDYFQRFIASLPRPLGM